jgi:hypothetical protein
MIQLIGHTIREWVYWLAAALAANTVIGALKSDKSVAAIYRGSGVGNRHYFVFIDNWDDDYWTVIDVYKPLYTRFRLAHLTFDEISSAYLDADPIDAIRGINYDLCHITDRVDCVYLRPARLCYIRIADARQCRQCS